MVSTPRGLLLLAFALAGAIGCAAAQDGEDIGEAEGAQRSGSSSSSSSSSGGADTRTAEQRIFDGKCNQCHAMDRRLVGPSYRAIADAYRASNRERTVARLTKNVKQGSSGTWLAYGAFVPMPENPYVTTAEAQWLVEYILDLPRVVVDAGTD